MRPMLACLALCLAFGLAFGCSDASKPTTHAADNTSRNTADKGGHTLTPTDQSESETDRKVTQDVRKALMDDSTLSLNAKNIKVITKDGKVTLRGVVASAEEKANIETKVKGLVDVVDCDNQLEVKTN